MTVKGKNSVDHEARRQAAIEAARHAGILGALEGLGSNPFGGITQGNDLKADVEKALKGAKVHNPDVSTYEGYRPRFDPDKRQKKENPKAVKSKRQIAIARAKEAGINGVLNKHSFDGITKGADAFFVDANKAFAQMKASDIYIPGNEYAGGFPSFKEIDVGGTIPVGAYSTSKRVETGKKHKPKKKPDAAKHATKQDQVRPHKHKHHPAKGHKKVAKNHGTRVAAYDPFGANYDLPARKQHYPIKVSKPKFVKTAVKAEKKLDGPALSWMPVSAHDTFAQWAPDGFLLIRNTKS